VWGSEFTKKAATLLGGGGQQKSCPAFVYLGIGPVVTRTRFKLTRYLIVVPWPLFAAALVVRRMYLIVV
jgi:hypothetical protein